MPSDPFMLQEKTTPTTSESIIGGATINPAVLITNISGGGLSMLPDGLVDGQVKQIIKTSAMCSELLQSAMTVGVIKDCCLVGTSSLFVGGNFSSVVTGLDTASPTTIANTVGFAKFNLATNTWTACGTGLAVNGDIRRIVPSTFSADILYVMGIFTGNGSGSVVCNGIMRYQISTDTFTGFGTGCSAGGSVECMLQDPAGVGTNFFCGGSFTSFNGILTVNIAYWNGATATLIGGAGGATNTVNDLLNYDLSASPAYVIVAVGDFLTINAVVGTIRIALYSSTTALWSALPGIGTGPASLIKSAVMTYTGTAGPFELFFTGSFGTVNGVAALKLAKYTISTTLFSALGGANTGTSAQISILNNNQLMVTGSMTNYIAGNTTAGQVSPAQICYQYGLYDTTTNAWYSGCSPCYTASGVSSSRRSLQQMSDGSFFLCLTSAPYIIKINPNQLLNLKTTGTRTTSRWLVNMTNSFTNGPVSIRSPSAIYLTEAGQSYTVQWNAALQKWVVLGSSIPLATLPQYQYNLTI